MPYPGKENWKPMDGYEDLPTYLRPQKRTTPHGKRYPDRIGPKGLPPLTPTTRLGMEIAEEVLDAQETEGGLISIQTKEEFIDWLKKGTARNVFKVNEFDKKRFLALLANGCSVREAADLVGKSTAAMMLHRKNDERFAYAWKKAFEFGTQTMEDDLQERSRKSDSLLMFALKGRLPDKYGTTNTKETKSLSVRGSVNVNHRPDFSALSVSELKKLKQTVDVTPEEDKG